MRRLITLPRSRPARAVAAAALLLAAAGLLWNRRQQQPPDATTQAAERARIPAGMVYIPGGVFLQGTDDADADDDQKPRRAVFVPSFYMDRTEVTNRQFRAFRPAHTFPPGEEELPVTNVFYADAAAYARWAGKTIPTEAQWEKAARGVDGRRYPWGDTWEPMRVAARRNRPKSGIERIAQAKTPGTCLVGGYSRVRPVGGVPGGVSVYGCRDMAGNAWEWVQGFYNGNPDMRILRGGAVGYGERACRTYARAIEGAGAT